MTLSRLRWWWHRRLVREVEALVFGDEPLPRTDPPLGYGGQAGPIVHAWASAQGLDIGTDRDKPLGRGVLVLGDAGVAFIGGNRPVRYAWSRIAGCGGYYIDGTFWSLSTKRDRNLHFDLDDRRAAAMVYAAGEVLLLRTQADEE